MAPIIILNTNNYFDPLIEMLNRAIEEQFMHPGHASIWSVVDTLEEAIFFKTKEYHQIDKNVKIR